MADYIRESRLWIARSPDVVFAFFADPSAVVALTPARLALRLATPPGTIEAGTVLDYRLRWLGVPLSWRAFIREYDPPYRFVDVQVRGPYARWEHRHVFVADSGGTWMEDRVTYRLPFGPLGRLAHAFVVGRQLDALWGYRERRIAELLGPIRSPAA